MDEGLDATALRRLLTAVDVLMVVRTRDELLVALPVVVRRALGCDTVAMAFLGPSGALGCSDPVELTTPDRLALFEARAIEYPLAARTRVRGGPPLRRSDVQSDLSYRATALYSELFAGFAVEHTLAFGCWADAALCVAANRDRPDFSDRDLAVAAALQPRVTAALVRTARLSADGLGPVRRADGASGRTLTVREDAVVALVAQGLANYAIGRRLGISVRTVHKHLQHVYAKLGVPNRTAAALRWQGRRDDGAVGGPGGP